MNEKEIDYNLLEVEKGNKRYGIYLKNHIQDQRNRIHDLLIDNTEYKLENERLNNIINEIEKYIKENSYIDNWDDRTILTNYLLEYIQELKENK